MTGWANFVLPNNLVEPWTLPIPTRPSLVWRNGILQRPGSDYEMRQTGLRIYSIEAGDQITLHFASMDMTIWINFYTERTIHSEIP